MLDQDQKRHFIDQIQHNHMFLLGGNLNPKVSFCGSNCRYCTELRLFKSTRLPRITDEEFQEGCAAVLPGEHEMWFVLPDPFTHPNFTSYLMEFSRRFPEVRMVLGTPGIPFDMDLVDFCNSHPKVLVTLSVNTFDPSYREVLLGRGHNLPKIVEMLKRLKHLVPLITYLGDDALFMQDIKMVRNYTSSANVYARYTVRRLEHSKYNPQDIQELSVRSASTYGRALTRVLKEYMTDKFVYVCPDLDLVMKLGFDKYELSDTIYPPTYYRRVRDITRRAPMVKYLFCSSPSAYNFWKSSIDREPNVTVIRVDNLTLSGTFSCAGFMCIDDIHEAITRNKEPFDVVLLPHRMFDREGEDFTGKRVSSLEYPVLIL